MAGCWKQKFFKSYRDQNLELFSDGFFKTGCEINKGWPWNVQKDC